MRTSNLTTRELEVADLIAFGATDKEVAAKLFRSPETIRTHRKNIYAKTGCQNTADLVRWYLGKLFGVNFEQKHNEMKRTDPDSEFPRFHWIRKGLATIGITIVLAFIWTNRAALTETKTFLQHQQNTGFVIDSNQVKYKATAATELTFTQLRKNLQSELFAVTEYKNELSAEFANYKLAEHSGFINTWKNRQVNGHIHLVYTDGLLKITISNIYVFEPDARYHYGGMNFKLSAIASQHGHLTREFKTTGGKVLQNAFTDIINDMAAE